MARFGDVLPQVLAYGVSFFVIARNWLAHHRMFRMIRSIDARFIAINITLLGFIALLPYPTDVYGNYPSSRPTLIVYAASISATGLASAALWFYASRDNRLIDPSTPARVGRPLAPARPEHPCRVLDLDSGLVHRSQTRRSSGGCS